MPNHNKYSHIPGKYYYIIGGRKPYITKITKVSQVNKYQLACL